MFFAQIDAGSIVTSQLSTVLGYATVIIPAGLLIWGVTWGVQKAKDMAESSSSEAYSDQIDPEADLPSDMMWHNGEPVYKSDFPNHSDEY